MSFAKPVAVVLVVLGVLGVLALVYGGFSYTRQEQAAKIGPVEVNVRKENHVASPLWAGSGAVLVGAALLVAGGRGRK